MDTKALRFGMLSLVGAVGIIVLFVLLIYMPRTAKKMSGHVLKNDATFIAGVMSVDLAAKMREPGDGAAVERYVKLLEQGGTDRGTAVSYLRVYDTDMNVVGGFGSDVRTSGRMTRVDRPAVTETADRLSVRSPLDGDGGNRLGYLELGFSKAVINDWARQSGWGVLLGLAAAVAAGLAVTRMLKRSVKGIDAIAEALDRVAAGDLDADIDVQDGGGIGRTADSLRRMVANLRGKAGVLAGMAAGNMRVDIEAASETDGLGKSIVGMRDMMVRVSGTIKGLVTDAVEGRLRSRGDDAEFEGDYRELVGGINRLMDSLVGHIDAVPAPVMIIDKEFGITYLNDMGAKVVGDTTDGVLGKKCYSLFKTSDCRTDKCALHRSMRSGNPEIAETDAHPAGLDLDIKYHANAVRNEAGAIVGAMETVIDQTEIIKANKVTRKIAEYQGREVDKLTQALSRFSQGDLTLHLRAADGDGDTAATREKFEQICDAFNESVASLQEIVGEIQESSDSVVSASEELSATAQEISKGAEHQASSLEETSSSITQMSATIQETGRNVETQSGSVTQMAASIEEMSRSIGEVARNAGEVNALSGEAARSARSGGGSVEKTIEGMNRINGTVGELSRAIAGLGKRSEEIGNIVSTINDIAEQTNLLALNAAIEAARAGEHGKGFAVVADEVRKLAERSQVSTRDIAELIKGIQDDTGTAVKTTEESARSVEEGITLVNEAGVSIKDIIRAVDDTNKLVAEISNATEQQAQGSEQIVAAVSQVTRITEQVSSATEEQSAGSEQIVKAVDNVNRITQQNSAAAEEMANSTAQLARLAENLRVSISRFKIEDAGTAVPDVRHAA